METVEQFFVPFSKDDQLTVENINTRKENCANDKIKGIIDDVIMPKFQQIRKEQAAGIDPWLIGLENNLHTLFLHPSNQMESIDIDGKDLIFNSKEEVEDFCYIMFGHQMHEDENAKINKVVPPTEKTK